MSFTVTVNLHCLFGTDLTPFWTPLQVDAPERVRKETVLAKKITGLLNEVRQLRDDTDSLVCNCNQPDCPFQESYLFDIQHSCRLRKKGIEIAHSSSFRESPLLRGIDRKSDGTIIIRDEPGEEILEYRLMKLYAYNSYSSGVSRHMSVSTVSSSQDCLVDSDNVFGTSSDDDSTFQRFEPKRRHVRRINSGSAKEQKRRITIGPSSRTFPTYQAKELRTLSLGSNEPLSQCRRNTASLPSCAGAHLENNEESLSTSSDFSCLSTSTLSHLSSAAQSEWTYLILKADMVTRQWWQAQSGPSVYVGVEIGEVDHA